ncbi:hypothetical protein HID58_018542 [Brassica napus]|uniref:Endoglucanase n=1 Tax=Brassica napus TaxID=3708 RepID=A0ABQ8DCY2_BRANA|nr:hypothetical protein HID58_018542 [Brassica napus]
MSTSSMYGGDMNSKDCQQNANDGSVGSPMQSSSSKHINMPPVQQSSSQGQDPLLSSEQMNHRTTKEIEELELTPLTQPSLEMKESWVLKPTSAKKKKKFSVACLASNIKLLLWLGGLSGVSCIIAITLSKTLPHDHNVPPRTKDNSIIAIPLALKFFNAQISGKLPEWNNVSWRGDSCLNDGGSLYPNLAGGYYDAGGSIKSSFTMSFSMTMLSWSVIEYGSKYDVSGELNHVKGLIKWGSDYFLKTFSSSSDTISDMVSQIGMSGQSKIPNDNYCWMRPEDINYKRDFTVCHTNCPHLAAEMAAALASASVVFRDQVEYSATLVRSAKSMYSFAEAMSSKMKSSEHWDDLIWGGAWMYYATGDNTYLAKVTSHELANRAGAFSRGPHYGVFGWDNKLAGTQLLLTRLRLFLSPPFPYEDMLKTFHEQTSIVMCSYLPDYTKFNRTKGGLILLNHGEPEPLQYAANAAFLATLYSDYLDASDTPGWYCGPSFFKTQVLRDFSTSQVDYILGKNPQNISYVVGFGKKYPKHVHHRGASIPKNKKVTCEGGWKWKESSNENPNTIEGAMVAGPDKNDGFHDVRANYNYTQATLVGNSGLVAALVASSRGGGGLDRNGIFAAITPLSLAQPSPDPET